MSLESNEEHFGRNASLKILLVYKIQKINKSINSVI